MSTLAVMKARISDELARTDLTSQIAYAISDAIDFYQNERFVFNESRALTFTTVAGQEFYTSSDQSNIPTLKSFDYVILYLGNIPWPLHRRAPIDLEVLNQNGNMRGQPWNYAYYNKQLRLGPVPDAAYSMRIAGRIEYAEPASDSEANNPWMVDAEKLIRCRAKFELYTHVLRNSEEAGKMKMVENEAFDQLKGLSNRITATGMIRPMLF